MCHAARVFLAALACCGAGGLSWPSVSAAGLGPLIARIVVSPNPTAPGVSTTVTAWTWPGARCGVRVVYGWTKLPATSKRLTQIIIAGRRGRVAWRWRPSAAAVGPARATVWCMVGGAMAVRVARFSVR